MTNVAEPLKWWWFTSLKRTVCQRKTKKRRALKGKIIFQASIFRGLLLSVLRSVKHHLGSKHPTQDASSPPGWHDTFLFATGILGGGCRSKTSPNFERNPRFSIFIPKPKKRKDILIFRAGIGFSWVFPQPPCSFLHPKSRDENKISTSITPRMSEAK